MPGKQKVCYDLLWGVLRNYFNTIKCLEEKKKESISNNFNAILPEKICPANADRNGYVYIYIYLCIYIFKDTKWNIVLNKYQ